jgi:hypothetical protein
MQVALALLGPHIAFVETLDDAGLEELVVDEVVVVVVVVVDFIVVVDFVLVVVLVDFVVVVEVQVPKPELQPTPQYADEEPLASVNICVVVVMRVASIRTTIRFGYSSSQRRSQCRFVHCCRIDRW